MGDSRTPELLGWKQNVNYLKPESILSFANIHLVSEEGEAFVMDKVILAASTQLFRKLLLDQDCDEKVVFNTQIPKEHLRFDHFLRVRLQVGIAIRLFWHFDYYRQLHYHQLGVGETLSFCTTFFDFMLKFLKFLGAWCKRNLILSEFLCKIY